MNLRKRDFRSPDKILLIRMSSVGDVILTTPLVRQLRRRYPRARIDYLIRREYAALLRFNPHLSNLIVLDTEGGGAELRRVKAALRRTGYDVIIDLHRNLRSLRLSHYRGHPPILKIRKNVLLRHLLVNYEINLYRKFYGEPLSVAEKYLRAAEPLGVSSADLRPELFVSPAARQTALRLWEDFASRGFRAVLAPGARHFTKRWPAAYYAELISQIFRHFGWRSVLVGGPEEQPVIEEIIAGTENDLVESLAGHISLLETIAFLKNAAVFISNDSGLMHAAAAWQIPQIALFGSTTRELGFFPLNPRAVVVENTGLACRPCTHIGKPACPRGHFKCMCDISPDRVLAETIAALASASHKNR